MKKGSFIIYDSDLENAMLLDDQQLARLMRALAKYRLEGTEPGLSDDVAVSILSRQMALHISVNEEKYKKMCQRNSESAKKRWQNSKTDASACERIPTHTSACLNDNDNENDNDNVNDDDNENDNENDDVDVDAVCDAKKQNKRKSYYNRKNDVPILLRDDPAYDMEAFTRKAIGIKYKKPESVQ